MQIAGFNVWRGFWLDSDGEGDLHHETFVQGDESCSDSV